MISYDILFSSIITSLLLSFITLFSEKIKEYIKKIYEKIVKIFKTEITYKIEYNALIGKNGDISNLKIHDNSDMIISSVFLY